MKDNGSMTRLKAGESTYIKMEHHTQGNGRMINSMDMECRSGLMVLFIKAISGKD